jgi:hypothetical protein
VEATCLSHLAGQNRSDRPVDRRVPAAGESYDGGKLYLQHLRSEASSTVGDVREKQRPSMAGGEEEIPADGELHG